MNKFEYKREGDRLVLTATYIFKVERTTLHVPTGTSWNGADIPKLLRPFFGGTLSAKNAEASLVHDWLIHIGWDYIERDRKFYDVLLKNRGPISSWLMYQGVRAFGYFYWRAP